MIFLNLKILCTKAHFFNNLVKLTFQEKPEKFSKYFPANFCPIFGQKVNDEEISSDYYCMPYLLQSKRG